MISEIVYLESDNEIKLMIVNLNEVSEDYPNGTPIDFVSFGVNRMDLCTGDMLFTTGDDSLTYADGGVVKIKLGMTTDIKSVAQDIAHGTTLKAFDSAHPNGQFIIHPKMKKSNLTLEVVGCTC